MIQLAWRFLNFQKDSALARWFHVRAAGISSPRTSTSIISRRPALVARNVGGMELASGQPERKNSKGAAYAYNIKALRDQDKAVAETNARMSTSSVFVGQWQTRRPKNAARGRLKMARHE